MPVSTAPYIATLLPILNLNNLKFKNKGIKEIVLMMKTNK